MLIGRQSWKFIYSPVIVSSATVGGPFESKCQIAEDFDQFSSDLWLEQDSYEKAEVKLLELACKKALEKAKLKSDDINFLFSGDLDNQITSSTFAARGLEIPYLGVFGACSTSMESLALASKALDNNGFCAPYSVG